MNDSQKLKVVFDDYVKTVFYLEVDIRFWKHFIDTSIQKFQEDNPVNRWISESGFSIYDIPLNRGMWLHTSQLTHTIEIEDLQKTNKDFFVWIMNLSLVRIYNSLELLLLRAVQFQFFPTLIDPLIGKKETNKVIESIKSELKAKGITIDTKNNRYLIEYLIHKASDFTAFSNLSVNPVNWKTSWKTFFEFISILRNIIAHHEMLVTPNVRNEINSIAGDMFSHYFKQPSNNKNAEMLVPIDEHSFLHFVSHINDFAGNTLKFISGENNLKFLNLTSA